MPNYDSPIGSKKFSASPLKEYEVPDESDGHNHSSYDRDDHEFQMKMQREQERDPAEVEREIKAAREARRTGKERLGEGAKRRIEMLLGMTRTTHTADVDGTVFIFQSLKAKEMRESISAAAEYDNTVQSPFEVRKQFLARSITSIGGIDFDQFIGSSTLESKLDFIEELDDALSNRLYDEYVKLSNEAREKFSIKTNEEAKSVVEDLKK